MPIAITELATPQEQEFVFAIFFQRQGQGELAQRYAEECLRLLEGKDTAEETASGHVVEVEGETVCLPDFLHAETARQRFRAAGIDV